MYKMTLIEKIVYLLNNEYITSNHKELGRVFIYLKMEIRDLPIEI